VFHNKIEILPSHLLLCNKLRYLDLSNNDIRFIPPEIGVLQSLQYFSVSCNKIENIPDELFFCKKLQTVSENKLKQLNLNHEWTADKLRQKLQTNSNNRLELQLFMLSGLPDTIFEVTELQSLKLEIINNVTIPAAIVQLEDLQELSLYQCSLKIHSAATAFLKENLKVLRVKFDDGRELPQWMYVLRNLEELHLIGSLSSDASKNVTLDSLRELKALKSLTLKSNFTKIPQSIVDVASHLQRLCICNDGTKLENSSCKHLY
uniref:Leucine rich repeat containing 8 VRAC subunit C n=1 Tax=Sinocyclocheilus anshuiensis TaxID=1608454 RepID=A0A671KBV8_9TELE